MLAENHDRSTDNDILERGDKAIIRELGPSGTIKYLRLRKSNNTEADYLKDRNDLFKDMSVEELSKNAREHAERINENR